MLEGYWMYVVFAMVASLLLLRARHTEESVAQIAFQVLLAFYLSRVIALTFFPFPIEASFLTDERESFAAGFGQRNNFVPFETVRDTWGWTFTRQILGNLILLFPLGVLMPLAMTRFQTPRKAALLVASSAAGIELLQLTLSRLLGYTYKSFDIDDIWLNTLGGITGVAVSFIVIRSGLYSKITHGSSTKPDQRALNTFHKSAAS